MQSESALQFVYWLLAIIAKCSFSQAVEAPLVTLKDGSILRGKVMSAKGTNKPVTEFLGIPFAEPPVGTLRFRKPVPKARWAHVWNATQYREACPQTPDTYFGDFQGSTMWNPNHGISEDCLYLNVWVPGGLDLSRKRTVMVWIYGGGFVTGTSTLDVYDGKIFSSEEDIILVSMNYRVSIFGFLYLGREEAPGNMGLWDQLLALKWVKSNIDSFGGDPSTVTIFGESAGGASVTMHVVSPQSAKYHDRAITQSGSATAPWALEPREVLLRRAFKSAEGLDCDSGSYKNESTWDRDKLLECMKRATWQDLRANEWVLSLEFGDFPWTPVVDGDFFVEHPITALKNGNFRKTQLMVGSNHEEANYFIIYQLTNIYNKSEFFKKSEWIHDDKTWAHAGIQLMPRAFQKNAIVRNAILHEYRDWSLPGTPLGRQNSLDKMMGDYHFLCNVNEFAQHFADHGDSVYYFYFTHRASAQTWPKWMGVLHGYEINFVFGEPLNTEDFSYTAEEQELSRRFMRYWANFARTGYCPAGLFFDDLTSVCLLPQFVASCGGKATDAAPSTTHAPRPPVDYDCDGRPDGYYGDYKPCSCCYYSCVGGFADRHKCPDPLKWDVESGSCLFEAYVPACGGKRTTTVKPESTTTKPVPYDCSAKPDGDYPLHASTCDQDYVSCSGGRAHARSCHAGMYYDEDSGLCLEKQYVRVCGGSVTVPPEITTVPADQTTAANFDCTGVADGNYAEQDARCERRFVSCVAGHAYLRLCPGSLIFDTDTTLCLESQYVAGCGGHTTQIPPATTHVPSEQPDYGFDCTGRPYGNYPDNVRACSRRYFTCSPSGVTLNRCPGSLFYDAAWDMCDRFANCEACSGTPRPPTQATDVPVTDAPPKVPFDCSRRADGNYPAGRCSNLYFQCAHGVSFLRQCATSWLRFSAVKDACVSPNELSNCAPTETEYNKDTFCTGKASGFYADPSKCNAFIVCTREVPFRFDCPPETVFDAGNSNLCLPLYRVAPPCGTAIDPDTFTCVGRKPGFYASALLCDSFYSCSTTGIMHPLSCAPGEAFWKGVCRPAIEVPGCSRPSAAEFEDLCVGDDWIFPHPNNCNELIVCVDGIPFPLRCAPGTPYFDRKFITCVAAKPASCNI